MYPLPSATNISGPTQIICPAGRAAARSRGGCVPAAPPSGLRLEPVSDAALEVGQVLLHWISTTGADSCTACCCIPSTRCRAHSSILRTWTHATASGCCSSNELRCRRRALPFEFGIIFQRKKNLFLAIQLLLEFDFNHATSKLSIIDHPTLKTGQIWPSWWF